MFWKKYDETSQRLKQMNELLKKSFANVKRDTANIFQWLNYIYRKNIEQEQLIKNPYNTIREYAEIRLTKVGRKLFSYLSLQPVSLVAPDIPVDEEKTRANMHFLILGHPSKVHQHISGVSYFPKIWDILRETEPRQNASVVR